MKHQLIKRFISTTHGHIETSQELYIKLKDLLQTGECHQAFVLYKQLYHSCYFTNYPISPILPSLIKSSSLFHSHLHHHVGLQLHCIAIKTVSYSDPVVYNSLVSMYAKFANVESARQVFDEMPQRDPISWNALVNCYVQNGCFQRAIDSFKRMCSMGYSPKPELTASILSLCSKAGLIKLGKEIHGFVVVGGMIDDSVFLPTAILDFYTRSGELELAFRVFDQMEVRNEVSWTAMIQGFTANRDHRMALDCFRRMQFEGIEPNRVTLISVMPICAQIQQGKEIHGYAIRRGFESDPCLSAALMHLYCQFGGAKALRIAHIMMEQSKERDVVMWSSIIGCYARDGDIKEATKYFTRMQLEGIMPNYVTLLAMVSACTNQVNLSFGRAIHSYALKSGLLFSNTCVGNSFITMYSKCGCLAESKLIFEEIPTRDHISWSSLIDALGTNGCAQEAMEIFCDMKIRGVSLDSITLLTALTACSHGGLVEEGEELFNEAVKERKISLGVEHYACQIDLLGRAGKIEEACEIVRRMPVRPSIKIWSSLVSACIDHGRFDVAEMLANELISLEPENAANYRLLGIVYAKCDDWNNVEKLWRLLRAKGLKKSSGFSKIEF